MFLQHALSCRVRHRSLLFIPTYYNTVILNSAELGLTNLMKMNFLEADTRKTWHICSFPRCLMEGL